MTALVTQATAVASTMDPSGAAPERGDVVAATVVDVLPNRQFLVALDGEGTEVSRLPQGHAATREITVHLAGAMRVHAVRLVAGDRVRIEISPFDPTKGRIVGFGSRRSSSTRS